MQKQKIFITGCLGFLGSVFIRKLSYEKLPYTICGIDRVNAGAALNNTYINPNCKLYIGDIVDAHIIDTIIEYEKPDIVLHAASSSDNKTIDNNIIGTYNVASACARFGVQKLLFISSEKVYGALRSDEEAFTENAILKPVDLYGASKASAELLIKTIANNSNLKYCIVRICNMYGKRQAAHKFIPKIIKSILDKEKVHLYEGGDKITDWMHIEDACSALTQLINEEDWNTIYNLSSNHDISNIELVHKICKVMDGKLDLISFKNDANSARCHINSNSIRSIGWKPTISLPVGLEQTITWYLRNKFFLR